MNTAIGPRTRAFVRVLSTKISQDEVQRILDNACRLEEKIGYPSDPSIQGLLYGQIQSGKTNNMLMAVARASDRGHRLFIILTSDNTWLYEQTLERVTQALPGLLTLGKGSFDSPAQATRVATALLHTGLVLVATKNGRVLERLQTFIHTHCASELRAVIFDDEADQASLNTLVNSDNDELSAINQAIVNIREYFPNHVYVQITATPQALFLQRANSAFAPEFTVAFEPGSGYVGGEAFFEANLTNGPMRTFTDDEVETLISEETQPERPGLAVPTGLRSALCSFFVAAGTKLNLNQGINFSCLCHISHRQEAHRRLELYINMFVMGLSQALLDPSAPEHPIAVRYLREAYNDIRRTHPSPPPFDDVCREIAENIASTHIQVLISGSDYRRPVYSAPFNILIGGNRLGRGVTIDRLLTTYYGRTSKASQVDTMLQHARMYGYRRDDMDAIRFFVSESLLQVFTSIYESDRQLRLMIQNGTSNMQAIVLSRSTHTILRPTRPSVVYLDSIAFYMPGSRYFPRYPLATNVTILDQILLPFDGRSEPAQVPIDFLVDIVNLAKSEPGDGDSWDDEAIRVCLQNMKEMHNNRGFLVVRTGRDISRGSRAMLSETDYNLYNPEGPTLTLYRYNSSIEKGWDGNPRWVPNLRFPDGNRYFMFSTL